MTLYIEHPGLLTTVQDRGRIGLQSAGVPVGGPMDDWSFRLANLLAGNRPDAAALEMTLTGAVFRAERSVVMAVCGADMEPEADGVPLPMWRPVRLPAGATVRFRTAARGCRTYVAFAGGVAVPPVLGSRSATLGIGLSGLAGRPLRAGDRLPIGEANRRFRVAWRERGAYRTSRWFLGPQWRRLPEAAQPAVLRAFAGREWERFTEEARRLFASERNRYTVSAQSNRMGYRLRGAPLERADDRPMRSEAVAFGTVQVPPDGQPIVLMADRQTTGGYPRIAQVAAVDLPLLAQLRPGDSLRFDWITADEAERLWLERERSLVELETALRIIAQEEQDGD